MTISRFEDLIIWQLGREFSKEIYLLTKEDCWREDFEFRSQIRNSSGSVPNNIAEGFERDGNNEFINFLASPKAHVARAVHNFSVRLTAAISPNKGLMS